jgi:hypothetical protein
LADEEEVVYGVKGWYAAFSMQCSRGFVRLQAELSGF